MKKSTSVINRSLGGHLALLALLTCPTLFVRATDIPYQNYIGTPNPNSYTFTAADTGDVIAYFAGTSATYDEQLGMMINGVMSSSGFGLDNHSSVAGQSFNLGHVNAGDTLVFVVNVSDPNLGLVYSDPSLNGSYDSNGSMGHNHVYSFAYTGTGLNLDFVSPPIPNGIYVGFEDMQFPNSDFNYFDETFVVTGVQMTTNSVPDSASTLGLMSLGLIGLAALRRSQSLRTQRLQLLKTR